MRRLVLVALFAVACGAVQAHAQSLALAYHGGDTYKYALHSTADETIDVGAMKVPLKTDIGARETVTVKSVDSSGTADLSIAMSNLTIKSVASGVTNTTSSGSMPAIDIRVAADGRILSFNGTSIGGNPFASFSGLGGGFFSAVLPDTAVKPGDTWSKDYDQANPLGSGTIHLTTNSKYLRDESLQGINAAVVETTTSGSVDLTIDLSKAIGSASPLFPGGATSMTIKGTETSDVTTWIDPSGHRVLQSRMTGSTDATMTMDLGSETTMPGLTGPFSIKGSATTDLTPA
jgi:hypothetical protein